jgi:hypothetical protein
VRVVFHLPFHGELFGEPKERFLIEAEEVAPYREKRKG